MRSARGCRCRQVVSRRVPLKRAGREWKGLSPFNKEKTPSFTVNDQKGFYHCFSSGKHGDIFGFVMETEGLSFPEAVERLAGDAGLQMPKPDPQFERAAKERLGAVRCAGGGFAPLSRRRSRPATAARRLAYAERRGLTPATTEGVPHRLRTGFEGRAQSCADQTRIQPRRSFSTPGYWSSPMTAARPTIASAIGSPSPFSTPSRASSPSAPARSMPAPSRNI